MGFGVHRFAGTIDENLVCGICSAVLEEAVLTPCGHSFCQMCLETWLARPGPGSCPECRGRVANSDARPILSIRNLINSLDIQCENRPRGCQAVFKLENIRVHTPECHYIPVECAGCGLIVNRSDMANHHVSCEVITAVLGDGRRNGTESSNESLEPLAFTFMNYPDGPVSELACRVAGLEIQVKKVQTELEQARKKNSKLEIELTRTKDELEIKRSQLMDQQYVNFDPDYEYGYSPTSISKLACLIARFLLKKPGYIDGDRLFNAVKRCYENYGRCSNEYEGDVHMLLATANASNWFAPSQKITVQCWLQCLNMYRQYKNDLCDYKS